MESPILQMFELSEAVTQQHVDQQLQIMGH